MSKITAIKIIHTIIWVVMVGATFVILYSAITKTYDIYLWISLVLLIIETSVLIFNKWVCPLTTIAEKYTEDRKDNFDIYLPNWLVKHSKIIFGGVFVVGIILLFANWVLAIGK